jgi:ubiquitin C-terminal hydrolase
MNASLQCILSLPGLKDYFLYKTYEDINFATKKRGFGACTCLNRIYTESTSKRGKRMIDPYYFHRYNSSTFRSGTQQDAHEFLIFLLSSVQEETTRRGKKVKKEDLGEEDSWDFYCKHNNSIVDDIFGGQLESVVQCETCDNNSYTYDPFLDLCVPVISARFKKKTLEASLTSYFQKEKFNYKVGYRCEKCKNKTKV